MFLKQLLGLHEPSQPTFPGGLAANPSGQVEVTPNGQDEGERDLARVCQGGRLFIVGRRRMFPPPVDATLGNTSASACSEIFKCVQTCVREEMTAQGALQKSRCRLFWPFRRRRRTQKMEELMRAVTTHVSIGPGLQVAQLNEIPPALWQPLYTICIGAGQVRVVTFAFVGGPVHGDRPDTKCTPFILRLVSSDLTSVAGDALVANYECQATEAETSLDHLVSQESTLFDSLDSGDWTLMGVRTRFASHISSVLGFESS